MALYDTFISTSTDKELNPCLGGLIINKSDHYSACPECVLHVLDALKAISSKSSYIFSFGRSASAYLYDWLTSCVRPSVTAAGEFPRFHRRGIRPTRATLENGKS